MLSPGRRARAAPALLVLAVLTLSCGADRERLEFRRHLRTGLEQMRIGSAQGAAAAFDACAAIDPDDPGLRLHRARLKLLRPDPKAVAEAAAAELEALAGRIPEDLGLRTLLREIYLDPAFGISDPGRAGPHADAFGRLGPALGPFAAFFLDLHNGRRHRPPITPWSVEQAWDAVRNDPDDLDARLHLGVQALLRMHNADLALDQFEAILAREPGLVAPRMMLADYLTQTYSRIHVDRHPDASRRLPEQSSVLGLEIARSYYERAFDALPPGSVLAERALRGLARVELQMGQWDDAVRLYETAYEFGGALPAEDRARILGNAGLAAYRRGDDAVAIRHFVSSLELASDIGIRWLLGLACRRSGSCPEDLPESMKFPVRQETWDREHPPELRFTDVAADAGIAKVEGAGPSAWGDVDSDGDLDLFVAGCDTFVSLYRNEGDGTFTDVSAEAGLLEVDSGFSATFADIDNDGDPDLYIGRYAFLGPSKNSLYLNNGDGTFTDVTESSGLECPGSTFVHAWGDFDNDGFLDLYAAQGIAGDGSTNRMFRNRGDGTFEDVTERAGLAEPPGTRTIGFALGDYDRDGTLDIFVNAFDGGTPCRLYRNRGDGTFEERASEAGVDCRGFSQTGYVTFFTDVDNDTWPDIILTKLTPWRDTLSSLDGANVVSAERRAGWQKWCPKLFRNNGDGTFTNISVEAGFDEPVGTMAGNVGDLDNDGFVDLYLATGDPEIYRLEPNRMFRNNGDATFTDVTQLSGTGHLGKGHGTTVADYDLDGDLDLYAPQGGFVHGDLWPSALYRNERGSRNGWLRIDLEGTRSNRDGIGAQVTVRVGGRTLYQESRSSGGFGSSNEKTLHFGLGDAPGVDSVEVRWPSGEVERFGAVPARTRLLVREGEGRFEIRE